MAKGYEVNDLVWAKMKGYPHWPAKIGKPPSDARVPHNKHYVFFYGTLQYGWVGASNLFPYSEHKDKFTKPCSRRGFSEAVWQIEEDPDLSISDNVYTPQGKGRRKRRSESSDQFSALISDSGVEESHKHQWRRSPDPSSPTFQKKRLGDNSSQQQRTLPEMAGGIGIRKKRKVTCVEEDEPPVPDRCSRKLGKRRKDSTLEVKVSQDLAEHTSLDQPPGTVTPGDRRYSTRRMQSGKESGGHATEGGGRGYVKQLTERYAVKKERLFTSPTERGVRTMRSPVEPSPQNRSDMSAEVKPSHLGVKRKRLTRSSVCQSLSKVTPLCVSGKVEMAGGRGRSIGPINIKTEKVEAERELGVEPGDYLESASSCSVGTFAAPQEVRQVDKHSSSADEGLICPEAIVQANAEALSPILGHKQESFLPESNPILGHKQELLGHKQGSESNPILGHKQELLPPESSPILGHKQGSLLPESNPILGHKQELLPPESSPILGHKQGSFLPESNPILGHKQGLLSPESSPILGRKQGLLLPESPADQGIVSSELQPPLSFSIAVQGILSATEVTEGSFLDRGHATGERVAILSSSAVGVKNPATNEVAELADGVCDASAHCSVRARDSSTELPSQLQVPPSLLPSLSAPSSQAVALPPAPSPQAVALPPVPSSQALALPPAPSQAVALPPAPSPQAVALPPVPSSQALALPPAPSQAVALPPAPSPQAVPLPPVPSSQALALPPAPSQAVALPPAPSPQALALPPAPSSLHLSLVSPSIPEIHPIPFNRDMLETTPHSPSCKLSMPPSSAVCPQSVGGVPIQFNPLLESTSVEAVLSGNDHTMFDFDSDIISLLDEVPDTIAWDTPLGVASVAVKLASGAGQEVRGVVKDMVAGDGQYATSVSGKQEMEDVAFVETAAVFGSGLKQTGDNTSRESPVGEVEPNVPVNLDETGKAMGDEASESSDARGEADYGGRPDNVVEERENEETAEEREESEIGGGSRGVELERVCAAGDVVNRVGEVLTGVLLVCEESHEQVEEEEDGKVDGSDGGPKVLAEEVMADEGECVMEEEEARESGEAVKGGGSEGAKEWMKDTEGDAAKVAKDDCSSLGEVNEQESLSAENNSKTDGKTKVRKPRKVRDACALRTLRSSSRAVEQSSGNTSSPNQAVDKSATTTTRIKKIVGIVRRGLRLRATSTSEESAELMALSPAKRLHVDTETPTDKMSGGKTASRSEPKEEKSEEENESWKMAPEVLSTRIECVNTVVETKEDIVSSISTRIECVKTVVETKEDIVSPISPSCDAKALAKTAEFGTSRDMTSDEVQVEHEATINLDDGTILDQEDAEKAVLKSTEKLEVMDTQTGTITDNEDALVCDTPVPVDVISSVIKTKCLAENTPSASVKITAKQVIPVEQKQMKMSEGAKEIDAGVETISLCSETKNMPMKVEDGDKECYVIPVNVAKWVESVEKDMALVCREVCREKEALSATSEAVNEEVLQRNESCKVVADSLSSIANLAEGGNSNDSGHVVHVKGMSDTQPDEDCNIAGEKGEECDAVGGAKEIHDKVSSKENGEPNAVTSRAMEGTVQCRQQPCLPPLLHVWEGMSIVDRLRIFNYNLKASLIIDHPNVHQALMTLRNLQEQHMRTTDLEQVPDLVHTLRKLKRYQSSGKVMKKAEELYARMKDMYERPQSVAPPLQRRTLVTSRKAASTMAEYTNKVSSKKSSATKLPQKITTKSTLGASLATPILHSSSMSHYSGSMESAESAKSTVVLFSMKKEGDSPMIVTPLLDPGSPENGGAKEGNEITDVIGRKPATRTLRDMNTPIVPVGVLKERPKITGSVRMKNVGSPSIHRRNSSSQGRVSERTGNAGGVAAITQELGLDNLDSKETKLQDQIVPS